MYLKYMAVEGFKSFPEWNGLELSPGTCILVGGNGTGKSNLTDALCWALGQSAPAPLRVGSLRELVFAGSDELWPLQHAEVTVVLDRRPERVRGDGLPGNVCKHGHSATHDGELPDGLLTITRRVNDEGVDTYHVDGCVTDPNGVREALDSVGIGFPPVSVIRQGELERLLLLDPVERRRAIEEAAGIPHLARRRGELDAERTAVLLRRERLTGEAEQNRRQMARLEEESRALREAQEVEAHISALRSMAVRASLAGSPAAPPDLSDLLRTLGLPQDAGEERSLAEIQTELDGHARRLAELGPVNTRAEQDLALVLARDAEVASQAAALDRLLARLQADISALDTEAASTFSTAHARVEQRFRAYYALLAPGGEAALPLVEPDGDSHEACDPGAPDPLAAAGVDVVVRPPGKVLHRVSVLSGGERSLAALSLALALFQEYASPFFVLDEVEPALDDTNIRRLQAVLDLVADQHQILMVSHQQRAKEAGDVVFGIERNLDGASQVKFRYEPVTRRLDVFRRTRASDHLRRHPDGRVAAPVASVTGGGKSRTMGLSGSPTQAALLEIAGALSEGAGGGPGAGPSRFRRPDYFHEDGTFRGIWDAYRDDEGAEPHPTGDGAQVEAAAHPGPQEDAPEEDQTGGVRPCC